MPKPIKVLYISPVAERGGAEVVLLNILKFHDRRAFEPAVCFLKPGPLVEQVAGTGARTMVFHIERLRNVTQSLSVVWTLRQVIQRDGIDIVFSNMPWGHVVGGLAAVGTPATPVWYQHGIPSATDPLDWLAAWIPAAAIYCNSRTTAQAQARLPRSAAVRVMAPGIDVARFSPSPTPHRYPVVAVGSSRVDLQACKLEYSIVSPK